MPPLTHGQNWRQWVLQLDLTFLTAPNAATTPMWDMEFPGRAAAHKLLLLRMAPRESANVRRCRFSRRHPSTAGRVDLLAAHLPRAKLRFPAPPATTLSTFDTDGPPASPAINRSCPAWAR
jgi:hypothetical protein